MDLCKKNVSYSNTIDGSQPVAISQSKPLKPLSWSHGWCPWKSLRSNPWPRDLRYRVAVHVSASANGGGPDLFSSEKFGENVTCSEVASQSTIFLVEFHVCDEETFWRIIQTQLWVVLGPEQYLSHQVNPLISRDVFKTGPEAIQGPRISATGAPGDSPKEFQQTLKISKIQQSVS